MTTAGAIGIAGILTRATDADQAADYKTGDMVFVTAGTTLTSTTWAYTGIDSPTMGTTSLTFVQTAGQGSFTGGNGITITGTSIAIDTAVTVDKTTAQTLTNKTLTTPIISSISNTGTVTLPTATDTLVARATTDTLTNKTLSGNTATNFIQGANTVTLPAATGTLPIILASSGTATSTTNSSSETNLAVVTIPAGIMGTNGHLSVVVLYKFTGGNGNKTATIRHSTISGDATGTICINQSAGPTGLTELISKDIWNANSASSQIMVDKGFATQYGFNTVTVITGSINTANVSYLNLNGSTANSGDTTGVVGYTVTFYPAV